MTLIELAMAVCLSFNNLPCNDIQVSDTAQLGGRVMGLTHLYNTGRIEIKLKPNHLVDYGIHRTRAVLVHEYAHAETYLQGELKRGHSHTYRKNCRAVARKLGTPLRECTV